MTAKSKNTHKGGRENRLPFFHACGERFVRRSFFTVRPPGAVDIGAGRGYNVGRKHGLEAVL